MNITLEAKPFEYAVEIPGYGLFYVRKLGAGAEGDILDKIQEIDDRNGLFQEQFASILDQEKELLEKHDEKDLDTLRNSADYAEAKKAYKEIQSLVFDLRSYQKRVQMSLWRSDDEEAMKRFKNDFSTEQVENMYRQVMEQVKEEA